MISLLIGYFGKGRINPKVRIALMLLGGTVLTWRLRKVYKQYKLQQAFAALEPTPMPLPPVPSEIA